MDSLQYIDITKNKVHIMFEGTKWWSSFTLSFNKNKHEWYISKMRYDYDDEKLLCKKEKYGECSYPKDIKYINVNDFDMAQLRKLARKYIHKN